MEQGLTRRAALIGSNWNNGTNASPFNWNLNNATSNVNRNISTQLVFVSENGLVGPCRSAKHRNIKPCVGKGSLSIEDAWNPQRLVLP
jgi:hypothetical protein